jgi:hypothetical protein
MKRRKAQMEMSRMVYYEGCGTNRRVAIWQERLSRSHILRGK